jgi:hypothetical protein
MLLRATFAIFAQLIFAGVVTSKFSSVSALSRLKIKESALERNQSSILKLSTLKIFLKLENKI